MLNFSIIYFNSPAMNKLLFVEFILKLEHNSKCIHVILHTSRLEEKKQNLYKKLLNSTKKNVMKI